MKRNNSFGSLALAAVTWAGLALGAGTTRAEGWTEGMKEGAVTFKSVGPLAFGPEGILFVADTRSAAITALATGDTKGADGEISYKVEGIDQKVAALLGTTADQILINDLAVNPLSRRAYLAVSRGRGPDALPVLIRVTATGQLEEVSTAKVRFSRTELPDAPAEATAGRRGNPRQESITDISFVDDRVVIAGLANEEFASTLRSIPFPFQPVGHGTSVEIYHGAHGQFETRAPIRTFVPFKVKNESQLLAAYTCTPLVQLPVKALTPGAKIQGKTIAELGNRNRPLDMIVYQKGGKDYLLLANSSRGVMKIDASQIDGANEGIIAPVRDGGTKGVAYETIAGWKGIEQLDRLDASHAAVLRKAEAGALNLESMPLP